MKATESLCSLSGNRIRLSIHAQVSVRSPVESLILNAYPGGMARLSVNLNKIALLRNSRRTGVPDVLRFGRIAHGAGADGLTAHPRPDERHIRRDDVFGLAELMRPWRPAFELNLEGYPDRRFLDIVSEVKPEQCTLV